MLREVSARKNQRGWQQGIHIGPLQAAASSASAAPLSQAHTETSSVAPPPPPNVCPSPPTIVLKTEQPLSPMIVLKTEQPSPPPVQDTRPPTFSVTPPVLGATPPAVPSAFKGLVDDLMSRCRQEDAIRHELVQVEQGIASTLAALEELKKRREELIAREAQARKERLDVLQCLQGAVSALQETGQPVLHFTLPAQSVAATEMLSSFGSSGSGTEMMFNIAQATPGAPPSAVGQAPQVTGMFPQASTPTAQELTQLLLPHLQQLGDVDINSLAATMASAAATTAPSSSSLPTMSPEVSGGPSSKRPTAKRKTTKDGEPAATTRKRPKAARLETDGDIGEVQMDQIPPCQEISAHDSAIVALKRHMFELTTLPRSIKNVMHLGVTKTGPPFSCLFVSSSMGITSTPVPTTSQLAVTICW
ncbi:hypothetical protein V5799_014291 [Amblyomma americanum]|uniref:Uncharacterized protein n=1 Tax=Amblyomma americanum TaxID=6943 RepID=A0AAQ4E3F8_AMBAM